MQQDTNKKTNNKTRTKHKPGQFEYEYKAIINKGD